MGARLRGPAPRPCPARPVGEESCGGHFRVEYQSPEGEAARDDAHYAYVAAWEWKGAGNAPVLHKEPLEFENVHLAQRSYK